MVSVAPFAFTSLIAVEETVVKRYNGDDSHGIATTIDDDSTHHRPSLPPRLNRDQRSKTGQGRHRPA
jgi:hypothetical protein